MPVVTPDGVGTLVTMHGHEVLTEGLQFHKVSIEYDELKEGEQRLVAFHGNPDVDLTHSNCRMYVTKDTMFKTPSGWKHVKDLKHGDMVRAYYIRCVVCQKPYFPERPLITTCSMKCQYAARRAKLLAFRPLNRKSVNVALEEGWAFITYTSSQLHVPSGIEVVRAMTDAANLYVAGILLSSDAMQSGYNKPTE